LGIDIWQILFEKFLTRKNKKKDTIVTPKD